MINEIGSKIGIDLFNRLTSLIIIEKDARKVF